MEKSEQQELPGKKRQRPSAERIAERVAKRLVKRTPVYAGGTHPLNPGRTAIEAVLRSAKVRTKQRAKLRDR